MTPAKASLRALLSHQAKRLGLTATAVEEIVAHSQITYWRAGQHVFTAEDPNDLVTFSVSGVVKLVCQGPRPTPMVVQFVGPGRFVSVASVSERPRRREFAAVAHTDAVLAMTSREVMTRVIAGLPPSHALRLMASSGRILSHLLYDKCLLLMMPLRDRLLRELEMLARDFGCTESGGIAIDLPLSHADLAELVVASRANVSRGLGALRRAGQVGVSGHRLQLRRAVVAA